MTTIGEYEECKVRFVSEKEVSKLLPDIQEEMTNEIKKNIPCLNCLCISVCREKTYNKLVLECRLILNYIANNTKLTFLGSLGSGTDNIKCSCRSDYITVKRVKNILNTTKWEIYLMMRDKYTRVYTND